MKKIYLVYAIIFVLHTPQLSAFEYVDNPNNPVIAHGPAGSWNEGTSSGPSIAIIEQGLYRLWYAGNSNYSTSTIWSFGQGDIFFDPLGDINYDYILNISDVIQLVNIILGNIEASEYQLDVADLNLDESVDVSDLQVMINTILE